MNSLPSKSPMDPPAHADGGASLFMGLLIALLMRGILVAGLVVFMARLAVFPAQGLGGNAPAGLAVGLVLLGSLALPWERLAGQPGRLSLVMAGESLVLSLVVLWLTWTGGAFTLWTWPLWVTQMALLAAALQLRWPNLGRRTRYGMAVSVLAWLILAGLLLSQSPRFTPGDAPGLVLGVVGALAVHLAWTVGLDVVGQGGGWPRSRERVALALTLWALTSLGLLAVLWPLVQTHSQIPAFYGGSLAALAAVGVMLLYARTQAGRARLPALAAAGLLAFPPLAVWLNGPPALPSLAVGALAGLLLPVGHHRWLALAWPLAVAATFVSLPAGAMAPLLVHGLAGTAMLALAALANRRFSATAAQVKPAGAAATDRPLPGTESPSERGASWPAAAMAGMTTTVAVLLVGGAWLQQWTQRERADQQADAQVAVAAEAEAVLDGLHRAEMLTRVLAAVDRSLFTDPAAFDRLARHLTVPLGPGASMQWAPQGVVTQVYPRDGNAAAVGHDLFKDPDRRANAQNIATTRRAGWQGPLPLKQGGQGLIYRTPVYERDGRFAGFAIALLQLPRDLATDGRVDDRFRFRVALGQGAGPLQVVWQSPGWQGAGGPVAADLRFPLLRTGLDDADDGHDLAVALRAGTPPPSDVDFWIEVRAETVDGSLAEAPFGRLQALVVAAALLGGLVAAVVRAIGRRRAAAQRRVEVDQVRAMFDKSRVGMMLFAADGQLTACNAAALAMLAVPDGQAASLSLSHLVEAWGPGFRNDFLGVLNSGQDAPLAEDGPGPFGAAVSIEGSLSRLSIVGRPFVLLQAQDVAQAKAAAKALADAKAHYQHLFEDSPDAQLLIAAADGTVMDCNAAAEHMLRGRREQIIGLRPDELSPPVQPDGTPSFQGAQRKWGEVNASGRLQFEWVHQRLDGEPFWVDVHIRAGEVDGQPVQFLSWRDISDRKRLEQVYRLVTDHQSDFVQLWGADGHSMYDSPSLTRLLGQRHLQGRALLEPGFTLVHPDDKQLVRRVFDELVNGGGQHQSEYRWVLPDGELRWVEVRAQAIPGPDGATAQVLAVSRDVTERRRQEDQLREARDAAEVAGRAKSEFVASVSHELRTPLNAIMGALQVLERRRPEARDRLLLQTARHASEVLLALVDDVIDFSRLSEGETPLHTAPFRLADTLAAAESMMRPLATEKGLSLRFHLEGCDAVAVDADQQRLRQILFNLLSNAVKFTEHGSVELHARCKALHDDRVELQVAVTDTGIGIPAFYLPKLFQRFSQVQPSRLGGRQGSGLGMAITKRLVDRMGGEIAVQSEQGVGTTFTVTLPLPLASALPPTPATEVQGNEGDPCEDSLRGLRVLYAEDNAINRFVVETMLEDTGVDLQVAENGRQAVDLVAAQASAFDVVLMDLEMPVMDGLEATKAIRRQPATARLPVVGLSANVLDMHREQALASGMDAFLAKPVVRGDLVRVLRQVVDGGAGSGRPPAAPGPEPARAPAPAPAPAPSHVASSPAQDMAATGQPWIDFSAVLALAGGRAEMAGKFLASFLAHVDVSMQKFEAGMADGQPEAMRRALHAFKGPVLFVKANPLLEQLEAMHGLVHTGYPEQALAGMPRLRETLAATVAAVRRTLDVPGASTSEPGSPGP